MARLKNKTRTIFRINLVRDINLDNKYIKEFAELVKKASPLFVEVKGYMAIGFARQRLGYEKMPNHKEIMDFSKKLAKATDLKILDDHERSRVAVLGKNKKELGIKKI